MNYSQSGFFVFDKSMYYEDLSVTLNVHIYRFCFVSSYFVSFRCVSFLFRFSLYRDPRCSAILHWFSVILFSIQNQPWIWLIDWCFMQTLGSIYLYRHSWREQNLLIKYFIWQKSCTFPNKNKHCPIPYKYIINQFNFIMIDGHIKILIWYCKLTKYSIWVH
jgi:hypothetical protein